MTKVMIFIDNSNYFNSIRQLYKDKGQDRVIDYYKIDKFVLHFLSNVSQYKNVPLSHIRTYYYDGGFTDILLTKIKSHLSEITDAPENQQERSQIQERLDKAIKGMEAQKKQINKMKTFEFFEVRLKPLQYSYSRGVIQKGVDVQLAVDLVSNAYLNNYDVAVLFSGDIDLYESVKLVKSLGKQVIIFSHRELMAEGMIEISDLYGNIYHLKDTQLDEFSHIFQKK